MTSRYDKKTNTLTLTIPGLIMLPEWNDDVGTTNTSERTSSKARLVKIKKAPRKKSTRKKSTSRLKGQ